MKFGSDWHPVCLKDLQAPRKYALNGGPFGSKLVSRDYTPKGIPVIRGANLASDGYFSLDELVFVSEDKANELYANNAHPGDLVFTQRGTLGQVGIIPNTCDYDRFVISQSQMKLTVDEAKADPYFLYYYFRAPSTIQTIHNVALSSGVPHINLEILRNFQLYVPYLPTQRRIASILSAYDDLIENNTRRIAILEEMAHLLYREWFVHYRFPGHEDVPMVDSALGPIPQGWEVVRFTDIADVLSGGTPKTTMPEFWNGSIPWFTPKDAPSSFYVSQTEKSITERGLQKCSSQLYPKDTVFITARGTVGKVLLAAVAMAMNQSCYALRGKAGVDQYFVFLAIRDRIAQLRQTAHGAVFDTIIVNTFERLDIVCPPSGLVRQFSASVSDTFDLILNLLNKNANLRRTRDLLLPRLVSGEVDVETSRQEWKGAMK